MKLEMGLEGVVNRAGGWFRICLAETGVSDCFGSGGGGGGGGGGGYAGAGYGGGGGGTARLILVGDESWCFLRGSGEERGDEPNGVGELLL